MKQIIQDLKSGETRLEEVPAPVVKNGYLLTRTTRSLVSQGTERMLVEFGKANLIEKARQQPDKVKQVLDKIRTDGLLPTLEAVFNKLGQPLPLGYCNVGRVVEVGGGVSGFSAGDRVVSNGNHAEFVCVPKHLAAKIPDNVSDDEAAFTVIAAIGLQGIRLLEPQLGETVVVTGLGLIGLVAASLLRASGCRVVGIDFDPLKVEIAKKRGIPAVNPAVDGDPVQHVLGLTGMGADKVLITASTRSDEVIHQACEMSRKRGKVVLVGVVGLQLRRDDFYKKELTFQVSCSYGAGRYDEEYENKGHDYPAPYVRWTEQRNFEAVLQALSSGVLEVRSLITAEVDLENYQAIYSDLRKEGSIASLLKYSGSGEPLRRVELPQNRFVPGPGAIGIIGAGNFVSSTIVPSLRKARARIRYIASAQGLTAKILAAKAGAASAVSDYREMLKDPDVSLVIVGTRHDQHAGMVLEALAAGKSVFVEKPLCLRRSELEEITAACRAAPENVTLTVGFNRRFSPLAVKLKSLAGTGAKNIVVTMNAGAVPPESWIQDPEVGGGRILGEACHLIDLCSFWADSRITGVCMNALGTSPGKMTDNASILLRYENGSNAVVNYFTNGSKAYPKERTEVFAAGQVLVIDNWRKLTGYGVRGFRSMRASLDKGHRAQFALLNERITRGGGPLIGFESIRNTTLASFACLQSLEEGKWIGIES